MAKSSSKSAAKAPAKAAPAKAPVVVATGVASTATKLTKRNATPLNVVLIYTGKKLSLRAKHNVDAWQAVQAKLPATAAQLAELPALQDPACVSPQAYLSYMLHRGYLSAKPATPAKPAKAAK
jgi:hypothetical protein